MKTVLLLSLCGIGVLLLTAIPAAAASLSLSNVTYLPAPPLVPGGQQQVDARLDLIPSATCFMYSANICSSFSPGTCPFYFSGPCTFSPGHELQMQTALSGARWTIQVVVDGRNSAFQTARGSAAFVNSFLLSYSSYHAVSLIVTIDGTVPQGAGSQVLVLKIDEIDDNNAIVPGSSVILMQPVAGMAATTIPAPLPSPGPARIPIPEPTTRSPGFSCPAAIAGLGLGVLFLFLCGRT
jgi:hypothetical protein